MEQNTRAKIVNKEKELITNSDILVQLDMLDENQMSMMKENQTLIGSLNSSSYLSNISVDVKLPVG